MRSKKVWRYWCDHCGKGGLSKHHMIEHEKHCTMNPHRVCGMCARDEDAVQKPMAELVAAYDESLEALAAKAEGCPACMLAGIRQWKEAHAQYPSDERWSHWDFKKACAEYWSRFND